MQASRLRVEFIRFALLIVLTIGLFSVAARAFDDEGARPGARGAGPGVTNPGATTTPGGGPSTSTGSSDGATPSDDGSGGDGSSGDGASGTDGTGGTSAGGTGTGGTGSGAVAAPELPRTGPDTALRLTGFALVLIAGGGLSLAGARGTD